MKLLVKFSNYKYVDSLLDGKLKASFPHEFNDPFDSRIYVSDANKERICRLLKRSFVEIDFYFHMIQTAQIACLIKCDPFDFYDSVLMWAHYADSGKNISVCFTPDLMTNQSNPKSAWLDVVYNKVPSQSSIDVLKEYAKTYPNGTQEDRTTILKKFFSNKHEKWGYEKEVRLMHFGFLLKLLNAYPEELKAGYSQNLIEILLTRDQPFTKLIEYGYEDTLLLDLKQKPHKVIVGYNFDKKYLPDLIQKCITKKISLSSLELPENFTNYEYKEKVLLKY